MTDSKHEDGMKHAPGVKCIVAVQLSPASQRIFNETKQLAQQVLGMTLKHIEQADNGRIVTIVAMLTTNWKCVACGCPANLLATEGHTNWEVEPSDGKGELLSAYSTCQGRGVFIQQHLIPIGDSSLLKDEPPVIVELDKPPVPVTPRQPVNGY